METDEKASLEKIAAAGYEARRRLEEIEKVKLNKQNAHLIGAHQKYLNSYGSGEKWWLYRRIDSVDGAWCDAFSFQTDCDGKAKIEVRGRERIESASWTTIPEAEFAAAWETFLARIKAYYLGART